jgi:diaminopimelate epimerase
VSDQQPFPLAFRKGHGTGNDFILLPDPDATEGLTAAQVQRLTDRRFGIGADGVLRVARTADEPEVQDQSTVAAWFMDYRNADGSIAEMCGNGARLFARHLVEAGLERAGEFTIATRGGPCAVTADLTGDITIDMGIPEPMRLRAMPLVTIGDRHWTATGVFIPNPHCVVFVDDLAEAGDFSQTPEVFPEAAFPHGANVEFVVRRGEGRIAMRVYERGVGETLSCGTGACAAMIATAGQDAVTGPLTYVVEVPGGELTVARRADEHVTLTGPAVFVAEGITVR